MPPVVQGPSREALRPVEDDEDVAEVVFAPLWERARAFSASIREIYTDEVLQEHAPWLNNGNGSCFLHASAHGLGYMARSEDTLSPAQAAALRDVWAAAALCFIYQGRFRSKAAYDRAAPGERTLEGPAYQLAIKRAQILEVFVPNNRPNTRGAEGSWHARLVGAIYEAYTTERADLPSPTFLLLAELEQVNVVVLTRDDTGRLVQAEYDQLLFLLQLPDQSKDWPPLFCFLLPTLYAAFQVMQYHFDR